MRTLLFLAPLAFTSCEVFGECEPGATRCDPNNPGQIEWCDCDSRGGELYAGCRVAPRWEPTTDLCDAGDVCISDGADASVCVPADLGDCTDPWPGSYCVDGTTVHRCETFVGITMPNADGSFDGVIAEYACDPGWVCDDTLYVGPNDQASCILPGTP